MKFPLLQVVVLVLLVSCSQSSNSESSAIPESNPLPNQSSEELEAQEVLEKKSKELSAVFSKAVQLFPDDSSSLYRFYYKTFPAETAEKMQKQIDRINALLDEEIVRKYREVNDRLKPLLTDITNANSVSKPQSERVAYLYSIYDKYRGGSLFKNVLSGDDNYTLVWRTFEIMADQSAIDTCFLSSLIYLDNSIRTNAELSQAMQGFIVKAIKNNPNGFLEMYAQRNEDEKDKFSGYAMIWDDPVEELISIFEDISNSSTDSSSKELASELLTKIQVN